MCKHCATHVAYAIVTSSSNTFNMINHLRRHRPNVFVDSAGRRKSEGQHLLLPAAPTASLCRFRQSKIHNKSILGFIQKDLQPYAVMENAGFRCLSHPRRPTQLFPS